MDPRYLLDTDTCIYIRQQSPEQVLLRFQKIRPGEAVISTITFGQLIYGAAKSGKHEDALRLFTDLWRWFPHNRCPRVRRDLQVPPRRT